MKEKAIIFILLIFFCSFSQKEKVNVAVLDLEAQGIKHFEAVTLSEKLRHELVRYGIFTILERNRVNEILKEQGFQRIGCTSTECVVEIGQLIGVQKMVAGTVGIVGETYLIIVRLIDVKTGEIVKTAKEEITGRIDDLLKTGVTNMARELSGLKRLKVQQNRTNEEKPAVIKFTRINKGFEFFYDEEPQANYEVIHTEITDLSEIDDEKELKEYKKKAIGLGGNAIIFKKISGMKMGDPAYQLYQVKVINRY